MTAPTLQRSKVDYGQRPMLVFWETTRACQVACRHCRASALTHGLPGELTRDDHALEPSCALAA